MRTLPLLLVRLLLCASLAAGAALSTITAAEAATPRLSGKLVMADLVTDDVAAARTFYGQLFGWSFRDAGSYVGIANGGQTLGGIFNVPRPADQEAQPRWISVFSTTNVSRAERAVKAAGGKVLMPPTKLAERGEQGVFADDEGALFSVVRMTQGDPEDYLPAIGDWIWVQLLTRDAQRAGAFYRALGGYEIVADTDSSIPNTFVLARDGYARAALTTIPSQYQLVRPTWLPFVRVASVQQSLTRARELGGKVLVEATAGLANGTVAVITDPTGAAIGVLEWTPARDGTQAATP